MTQYLRPLLERLAGILNSSPSVELQAGALSAISSSAAAAGPGFTPYARDALALLRGFMHITEVRCLLLGRNPVSGQNTWKQSVSALQNRFAAT